MHSLSILALVSAATAIDIRMWQSWNCQNSASYTCLGVNPNSCCGIPSGTYNSIGFYGIPVDWNLDCRGHENGRCRDTKTIEVAYNTNFKCLTNGPYTGAGYGFRGNKIKGVKRKACSDERTPDRFTSEDGKVYSLSQLSLAQLVDFVEQTSNGTVPAAFDALELK